MFAIANNVVANLVAWTPGPWEIVLIVVAILILFGGRKIPELARGIGKGLREFKREMGGVKRDLEEAAEMTEEDEYDRDYDRSRRKKKRKRKKVASSETDEPADEAEDESPDEAS